MKKWMNIVCMAILLGAGIWLFLLPVPTDYCYGDAGNMLCPTYPPKVLGIALVGGSLILWVFGFVGEKTWVIE